METGNYVVLTLAAAIIIAILGLAVFWRRHRIHRNHLYAELARTRHDIVQSHPVRVLHPELADQLTAVFARSRIVTIPSFIDREHLERLRSEARENLCRVERSFIPGHKKGGTVAYERLHRHAPACVAFYHSPVIQQFVSQVVGVPVFPTPDQDQSSLSLLCYTEAGDHIQWHYDHNFYRGRHFTVLLPLINSGPDGRLSQSEFQEQRSRFDIHTHETAPNTLVIFEGARVRHRATPIGPGDERLMLSMTYSADPRNNSWKEFIRRVKDTAFYGLRALWD